MKMRMDMDSFFRECVSTLPIEGLAIVRQRLVRCLLVKFADRNQKTDWVWGGVAISVFFLVAVGFVRGWQLGGQMPDHV